jgi:hypothetical protein
VGAHVGHARIGDAFFYEAMHMDIDVCIYHEYEYCICVCSLYEGVALAHMSCRAVSSARSRDRTCIYGRHNNIVAHLYISQESTSIYVYINIYLTCASRYAGGHTHKHKMSRAASSARAVAHTCTWRRCIHMRTRSLSITEVYSYLLRVPPVIYLYEDDDL